MQGPPGTGKTFVGVKIVQLLLSNTTRAAAAPDGDARKPSIGPILCVCYTNHALDQARAPFLDQRPPGQSRRRSERANARLHDSSWPALQPPLPVSSQIVPRGRAVFGCGLPCLGFRFWGFWFWFWVLGSPTVAAHG